ncbi:MAG: GntR family transcriptional regulator [Anaeroplasmataceae bacterium]|nr:GntR family transcriptional regulator [Anaeroplasmataceae bacterium]
MEWKKDKAIYLQVIDLFKANLMNGKFKMNDKIPSVREYSMELNINPNTIAKVYEILSEEGWIEARSTNGYFISANQQMISDLKTSTAKEYCKDFLLHMQFCGFEKEEIINFLKGSENDVIRMP